MREADAAAVREQVIAVLKVIVGRAGLDEPFSNSSIRGIFPSWRMTNILSFLVQVGAITRINHLYYIIPRAFEINAFVANLCYEAAGKRSWQQKQNDAAASAFWAGKEVVADPPEPLDKPLDDESDTSHAAEIPMPPQSEPPPAEQMLAALVQVVPALVEAFGRIETCVAAIEQAVKDDKSVSADEVLAALSITEKERAAEESIRKLISDSLVNINDLSNETRAMINKMGRQFAEVERITQPISLGSIDRKLAEIERITQLHTISLGSIDRKLYKLDKLDGSRLQPAVKDEITSRAIAVIQTKIGAMEKDSKAQTEILLEMLKIDRRAHAIETREVIREVDQQQKRFTPDGFIDEAYVNEARKVMHDSKAMATLLESKKYGVLGLILSHNIPVEKRERIIAITCDEVRKSL